MKEYVKMEIYFPKEDYDTIEEYINHVSSVKRIDKLLHEDITIKDFIIGATRREIENVKNINEVFCELKYRGYVRPIKLKNNFKDILKSMGLKQLDLEDMTGIGNSDISGIVNNRKIISLDHFLRIWIALGCPDISKIFYVENKRENFSKK